MSTDNNDMALYETLAKTTESIRHWQKAKAEYVDARDRAQGDINHADRMLAEFTERLNETLTALNLPSATMAGGGE